MTRGDLGDAQGATPAYVEENTYREGSVEDSGEPEGEGAKGELAGQVGDRPFSRLALVSGVGFAGLLLAWTIMRTISEGFGWPYYGWPY
jgi:hypothetical protein